MRSCSSRKKRRRPAGRSVRWSLGPPQRSKAFLQRHGNRDPMARRCTAGLLREMAGRGVRASEALSSLGVKGMNREELETIVDAVLDESEDMIRARGETAEKALMGRVMERVRGRADGKLVSEVLHARLAARVSGRKDERKKGKR